MAIPITSDETVLAFGHSYSVIHCLMLKRHWAKFPCAVRYSQNLKEKTGHMKQMSAELEMYHNQAGAWLSVLTVSATGSSELWWKVQDLKEEIDRHNKAGQFGLARSQALCLSVCAGLSRDKAGGSALFSVAQLYLFVQVDKQPARPISRCCAASSRASPRVPRKRQVPTEPGAPDFWFWRRILRQAYGG